MGHGVTLLLSLGVTALPQWLRQRLFSVKTNMGNKGAFSETDQRCKANQVPHPGRDADLPERAGGEKLPLSERRITVATGSHHGAGHEGRYSE